MISVLWVGLVLKWHQVSILGFHFLWFFSSVVFWVLGLICMGTLRSSLCGNLNPFLDTWGGRLKLCPQTRQQEGVKLWPFIASGLQEQKLRLNHAQAVQAPGCSRGGIYSCLCLLIRHISLMALQPVIPCGTSSGQKGFSPTVSLLLGYHL